MDRIKIGVAVVAFAALALTAFAVDHTKDKLDDVKKAVVDDKAVLIDVREADEWKEGHLKDAKSLSLSDLKAGVPGEKLKAILPAGKVVYLHCAAGGRCLKAADLLKAARYETRPLKPGYDDLVEAGFEKAK
ncbi:hypothetical protein BH11PLA2_BH11PLA2_44520 [soil metagenome]